MAEGRDRDTDRERKPSAGADAGEPVTGSRRSDRKDDVDDRGGIKGSYSRGDRDRGRHDDEPSRGRHEDEPSRGRREDEPSRGGREDGEVRRQRSPRRSGGGRDEEKERTSGGGGGSGSREVRNVAGIGGRSETEPKQSERGMGPPPAPRGIGGDERAPRTEDRNPRGMGSDERSKDPPPAPRGDERAPRMDERKSRGMGSDERGVGPPSAKRGMGGDERGTRADDRSSGRQGASWGHDDRAEPERCGRDRGGPDPRSDRDVNRGAPPASRSNNSHDDRGGGRYGGSSHRGAGGDARRSNDESGSVRGSSAREGGRQDEPRRQFNGPPGMGDRGGGEGERGGFNFARLGGGGGSGQPQEAPRSGSQSFSRLTTGGPARRYGQHDDRVGDGEVAPDEPWENDMRKDRPGGQRVERERFGGGDRGGHGRFEPYSGGQGGFGARRYNGAGPDVDDRQAPRPRRARSPPGKWGHDMFDTADQQKENQDGGEGAEAEGAGDGGIGGDQDAAMTQAGLEEEGEMAAAATGGGEEDSQVAAAASGGVEEEPGDGMDVEDEADADHLLQRLMEG